MKLDVKKLSREELENLLVALTFDKSFYWYSNENAKWRNPNRTRNSTHAVNFNRTLKLGEELTKILEFMSQHPDKNFYCKHLAEHLDTTIGHTSYLLKLLVTKGVVKRFTKTEVVTINTYRYKLINGISHRLNGTEEILVDRAYFRLAEEG